MLGPKKVIYYAFIGAVLLFVLPAFFFIRLSTITEIVGLVLQFLAAWAFLGFSMFYHGKFYLKRKNWVDFISRSLVLFVGLTGIDILINGLLEKMVIYELPNHAPILPETIVQNGILSLISLFVVHQYAQRQKNEAYSLKIVTLEKENLQLQLNSLQQQLNPHFFFNSLNTLSELIYIDVEKSESYINELSKVFRYILNMQRSPLVSLDQELRFIQSYFFLLKIRYHDKLHLDCRVDKAEDYQIPSLSLLVLLENVIKHNAINSLRPMSITIDIDGTFLSVRNNKNPLPLVREGFGIGLENLNNRCQLLTNEGCIIEDEEDFFMVKIPLKAIKG